MQNRLRRVAEINDHLQSDSEVTSMKLGDFSSRTAVKQQIFLKISRNSAKIRLA